MTKFSKLETNFWLSSEKNLGLNSKSREAVIAVESRDHLSNGVSPKDQMSRKRFFNTFVVCLSFVVVLFMFATCNKDDNSTSNTSENILDQNVEGSKLTSTLCIKLVRDYWDCSMGATFYTGQYWYQWGCKDGDRGKITATISDFFTAGINTEKSYYRDYILYLEIGDHAEHLIIMF